MLVISSNFQAIQQADQSFTNFIIADMINERTDHTQAMNDRK
jgi:hypothetical protein